jgi:hippurate hydrolase
MLSGAARMLSTRRSDLKGQILFMFQPSEEGHFGARFMLHEDLLNQVDPFPTAHSPST